jgi:hypothetical protein
LNSDDNDAWDLATLAAQLLRRRNTESDAVDAAWALVEAAKDKLEEVRLEALAKSPEAQSEWEKQQAERLDSLKIPYEKGVKIITSQTRLDNARKLFKDFLGATRYKDRPPEQREPYVEAWQAKHRSQGFTGTELKKLKGEYDQWRGKGRQGRVKKRGSDGRLKANREKKRQAKGKEGLAELTKPKVEWRTKHYRASVLKGARGKKGRTYQGSADNMRDTPRDQTFDANPGLKATLSEPL